MSGYGMNDLISRQDAIDALCFVCGYNCDEADVNDCAEHLALKNVPSAEPKAGGWKLHKSGALFICSVCGETNLRTERYCPNCGAKMVGEQDATD